MTDFSTGAAALSQPLTELPERGRAPKKLRLTALDAWRGLTVLLMLLVNNVSLGDNTPAQLTHASFGGLTLTDMVFPWFLFCAGAALPFSLAAMDRAGVTGSALTKRLLTRAALLYLVGVVVTNATVHSLSLGLGVLQLIALSSLFAALLGHLRGRTQTLVAGGLLLGYALFLLFFPHDAGFGVNSETANPVQAINDTLLNKLGLRGLLSVIPTTALVLLGSLAARPLQQKDPRASRILLLMGAGLSLAGLLWGKLGHIPFSKALWTPPYILYSAGLATLGILVFWWLADSGSVPGGAKLLSPLTIPGRNALAGYVLPILLKMWILLDWQVHWTGKNESILASLLDLAKRAFGTVGGGWIYTLGYVLAVWLGLAWMARKDLIWKL